MDICGYFNLTKLERSGNGGNNAEASTPASENSFHGSTPELVLYDVTHDAI
jgi:hypothetical protein